LTNAAAPTRSLDIADVPSKPQPAQSVVQHKAGLLHGCNDSREFPTDAPVIRTISSAGSYAVPSIVSVSSSATPPQHAVHEWHLASQSVSVSSFINHLLSAACST